jgi:UDP-N-acetylmuramate dehydrogenase
MMQIRENISLKPFNTFGLEATARYFVPVHSIEEAEEAREEIIKRKKESDVLVLGGGSNILLTRDVDGVVLKNEITGIQVKEEDHEKVLVKAGAGESWHKLVLFCVERGFAGMENLSLIPGYVGASPMQNIGAYGVEIKDVFHELEAIHLKEGYVRTFTAAECHFGYRESIFKRALKGQYLITSVTFRLSKIPVFHTSYGAIQQELDRMGVQELSIKAISDAVINIRTSKLPDPKETGNAGSFFKNPEIDADTFEKLKVSFPSIVSFPLPNQKVKLAAGWLIEQCGWKGFRRGDAGCYPKQALVLVNWGNAQGHEIFQLSEEIIQSVKNKFGVELEREVNVI